MGKSPKKNRRDSGSSEDSYDVENPPRRGGMRPRISIDSQDYEPPKANMMYIGSMCCCLLFVVLYTCAAAYVAIEQRNFQRQEEYNNRINAEITAATAATGQARQMQLQQQNSGGLGGFLKMYGAMFGLNMFGGMLMPMGLGMMI